MLVLYLFFLIETLLVAVGYAEAAGVEDVGRLEAGEHALQLPPTGTLTQEDRKRK